MPLATQHDQARTCSFKLKRAASSAGLFIRRGWVKAIKRLGSSLPAGISPPLSPLPAPSWFEQPQHRGAFFDAAIRAGKNHLQGCAAALALRAQFPFDKRRGRFSPAKASCSVIFAARSSAHENFAR